MFSIWLTTEHSKKLTSLTSYFPYFQCAKQSSPQPYDRQNDTVMAPQAQKSQAWVLARVVKKHFSNRHSVTLMWTWMDGARDKWLIEIHGLWSPDISWLCKQTDSTARTTRIRCCKRHLKQHLSSCLERLYSRTLNYGWLLLPVHVLIFSQARQEAKKFEEQIIIIRQQHVPNFRIPWPEKS